MSSVMPVSLVMAVSAVTAVVFSNGVCGSVSSDSIVSLKILHLLETLSYQNSITNAAYLETSESKKGGLMHSLIGHDHGDFLCYAMHYNRTDCIASASRSRFTFIVYSPKIQSSYEQ